MKSKVTIVIPLYNVESYITRCLDSILGQTYRNLEVIVVDDASTDKSLAIVERYQETHPQTIRIIRHEKNIGPMSARRDAYMAATGEYIMFVDADDALPKDAVEKLLNVEKETDADIVAGTAEKIYVDGRKEYRVNELTTPYATPKDIIEALLTQKFKHSLWGKLYKTSIFHENEFLCIDGMTISEDACLFYQLAEVVRSIKTTNEIVYYYYENKTSSTNRVYSNSQLENIIIAQNVILNVCKPYDSLQKLVQIYVTKAIFSLYSEKVSLSGVKSLLKKHSMEKYGSIKAALRFLSITDYYFLLKRYIYVRTKLTK